ncbi:phytoene synthase [Penicillium frequentans]|uniref:Bifunctional lycopene cyclase/phytoene synthase n=1 Tax=Penicillium frequentans TaxID=3151616 RepID=A0AAD6D2G8_9EURO|nr:phytoene synthase [Penicillium glabrum]
MRDNIDLTEWDLSVNKRKTCKVQRTASTGYDTIIRTIFYTNRYSKDLDTLYPVIWTIPWDSFLIHTHIWTYPTDAIIGLTLFKIPIEEVFFFIIQTYNTSLLYTLLGKRLLLPIYLSGPLKNPHQTILILCRDIGTVLFSGTAVLGLTCMYHGGKYMYMGLILTWVSPVLTLQWLLTYRFLLALPPASTIVPILLPTAYLWLVDTIALRRGTWVIETGTKLDIQIWSGLEIEEALFFFVTNTMIVFGLVAIDNAIALHEYKSFTSIDTIGERRSVAFLIAPFLQDNGQYDLNLLRSLSQAVESLQNKSQSMYLGSATFEGQLRMDLISLYSFCRNADDLIDDAPNCETAKYWIKECAKALDVKFNSTEVKFEDPKAYQRMTELIPAPLHVPFHLLPVSRLLREPFFSLLEGFKTDLEFHSEGNQFPIATEKDLELYAYRVAGTIAELLLDRVFRQYPQTVDDVEKSEIISSGERMGQALQYVNIARDIVRDAAIGRVYIPNSWLSDEGLTPSMVVKNPNHTKMAIFRERLLDKAETCYAETQIHMDRLPCPCEVLSEQL